MKYKKILEKNDFHKRKSDITQIFSWMYTSTGIPLVTFSKEKIEIADDANKIVSYSVIDGDLVGFYKNFKATLQVIPKGDGGLVKWSLEFEKAKEEVPDPDLVLEFAVKTFKDLDAYLKA